MTDVEELFRPLIEDAAQHREPVAAIEARARERGVRRRRQRAQYRFGAGFLAMVLIATTIAVLHTRDQTSTVRPVNASTTTRPPTPAVATGWTTYDYGLARLSIPPGWSTTTGCPEARTFVMVDPSSDRLGCGAGGGVPDLEIEPIPLDRAHEPYHPDRRINGIAYEAVLPKCVAIDCPSLIAYVPDLEVAISFVGIDPTPILDTLTLSTFARVVEQPFGSVPASWRTVTYAGYSVRVPRSWPVVDLSKTGFCYPSVNTAYVGTPIDIPSCPSQVATSSPEASLQLEHGDTRDEGTTTTEAGSLAWHHNGLNFTRQAGPTSTPLAKELFLDVDGPHGQLFLTLGLGLDPAVARGILGSVELAP